MTNIVRHPDMPRIVFKILWEYIKNKYEVPPQIRTGSNGFPIFRMIIRLPVFGMPPAGRLRFFKRVLLMINAGSGSVFTDGDTQFRVFFMSVVQPFSQIGRSAAIPSVVPVPRDGIRNENSSVQLPICYWLLS